MIAALWRDRSMILTLWMQFGVQLSLLRAPVGLYYAGTKLHSSLCKSSQGPPWVCVTVSEWGVTRGALVDEVEGVFS